MVEYETLYACNFPEMVVHSDQSQVIVLNIQAISTLAGRGITVSLGHSSAGLEAGEYAIYGRRVKYSSET